MKGIAGLAVTTDTLLLQQWIKKIMRELADRAKSHHPIMIAVTGNTVLFNESLVKSNSLSCFRRNHLTRYCYFSNTLNLVT